MSPELSAGRAALPRSPVRRPGRLRGSVALGGALLILVSACGSKPAAEPVYGSLPDFLPTPSIQADAMLTGTAARPALTVEGDVVQVKLNGGASVRATVTGPEVPGEGLPYEGPATTCTWTVTLTGASTEVPIDIADFSSIDHLGTAYHPGGVPGQPAIPTVVQPGQTVTFQMRAVMRTGEGLMRWAPRNSLLASWDFEVEND